MRLSLEDMYAYRFFESEKGPLDTIRKYSLDEIDELGNDAGIRHIREIYKNRVNMEKMMLSIFRRQGGNATEDFPIYFAVYNNLPASNKLHVRFKNPKCIKIPMKFFYEEKDHISFTYGLSTHAFTRKDDHPCKRKLLMWEEAEEIINEIAFDEKEDIWLEMQVWDESCIKEYYHQNLDKVFSIEVKERLSGQEIQRIREQYDKELVELQRNIFFEPNGPHGVMHAIRVRILTQYLADMHDLCEEEKEILKYCALYHDIGRTNNIHDYNHGIYSYQKVKENNLLPQYFTIEQENKFKYIVENHPYKGDVASGKLGLYNIHDKKGALNLLNIFKDADILDLCRYGSVNKHNLHFMSSRDIVPFAFQLIQIYREHINNRT